MSGSLTHLLDIDTTPPSNAWRGKGGTAATRFVSGRLGADWTLHAKAIEASTEDDPVDPSRVPEVARRRVQVLLGDLLPGRKGEGEHDRQRAAALRPAARPRRMNVIFKGGVMLRLSVLLSSEADSRSMRASAISHLQEQRAITLGD